MELLMIFLYGCVAFFISWIWIDYYRLIDIYESEKLKYIIITFILGALSVFVVFGVHQYLFIYINFELNGEFVNDFLLCIFKIGLLEEIAKLIPFIIVYNLFRKEFNEPIDHLAFICVSALGFAFFENILYFRRDGASLIDSRSILSTVGHMFDTSLIAYGLILVKYREKKPAILILLFYLFLAALSHGFYDFWLMYDGVKSFGFLITILYFLVTISIFATILNNALNISPHFTYKKVVNPSTVSSKLFMYYGIIFLIQFVFLIFMKNFNYALRDLFSSLRFDGVIIGISVIRLSRFKLIHHRWKPISFELPFTVGTGESGGMSIQIKGEAYNEAAINAFYEEYFFMIPVTDRRSYFGSKSKAYIEQKIFLKDDATFYVARIFAHEDKEEFQRVLLRPKTGGMTMMNGKYPLVGILKIANDADLSDLNKEEKDFKFYQWSFIKPIE
jgi:RsiW-degrading membrane proteinase PrsW (M82 family)